jgi:branched-chain amino acid transport system permease protein
MTSSSEATTDVEQTERAAPGGRLRALVATAARARTDLAILTGVVVVLALVPAVVSGQLLSVAVRMLLFALLGVAWNVMGGFAGQFSFGHAAFFGLGAYTTGVLLVDFGVSPWIGMAAGAVIAALYGALAGWLSFRYRLQGAYFALATFAFAEMLRLLVLRSDALGGAVGYRVPLLPEESWPMLQFPPDSPNYYLVVLGLLAGALLVTILVIRSTPGLLILAVRENEAAAEAAGVASTGYKVAAVALSAALTAIGGGFYLMFYFFVDPEIAFGARMSVEILLPAIIGGVGTIWGPAIGAVLLIGLGELATVLVRNPPTWLGFLDGRSGVDLIIFAVLLVMVILFLPRGVYGTFANQVRR